VAKRLLVLGAGRHQKALIRRAEARGVEVVVADYYPDAPGKAFASHSTLCDALDSEACIAVAKEYAVDGVITSGTDLAVVTMADVAAELGLPCAVTPESARRATNKLMMSAAYEEAGVRRPAYREVSAASEADAVAASLELPVVVKPADSQGQRGTRLVTERAALDDALDAALAESRVGRAIVEAFISGPEITVSAWVQDGVPAILTITDRVTFNPPPAIGICFQHVYPSVAARGLLPEIQHEVGRISAAYELVEGPLYIQMLVHGGEVYVVEAGARVGGGHEASLIPLVTGVDVTERLIDLALEGRAERFDFRYAEDPEVAALVNFLVANPGIVSSLENMEALKDSGVLEEGEYYVAEGHVQEPVSNSLGRVGYFLTKAEDRTALLRKSRDAYSELAVRDGEGRDLLFVPDGELMNDV
jgi:biotin carboxylase